MLYDQQILFLLGAYLFFSAQVLPGDLHCCEYISSSCVNYLLIRQQAYPAGGALHHTFALKVILNLC